MAKHPTLRDARLRRLAVGLASALAAAGYLLCPADAGAATAHVTNCFDSGGGSLRSAIAAAGDGGVVVFDPLPCSTITLTSGAIGIPVNNMYLAGPGRDAMSLNGSGKFGVLRHTGSGTLSIHGLTIRDGKYQSGALPFGGCVYSASEISLVDSAVVGCMAAATGFTAARGGGIYARGAVKIENSTVSGNTAAGLGTQAKGGAVFAKGNLTAKYSIFTNNEAVTSDYSISQGGGMWTLGDTYILGSLISGNKATFAAAIGSQAAVAGHASLIIVNSTVSENSAFARWGGIYTNVPLTLASTTVAFNNAPDGAAVYVVGSALTLKSSIIADNASNGQQDDLGGVLATPTGYNNLITSSTIGFPAGTITSCPKLGPLASNGAGPMLTHAVLGTSPALNAGVDVFSLARDQRGFPRQVGNADIGAFERQGGQDDRIAVAGFEPVCDH